MVWMLVGSDNCEEWFISGKICGKDGGEDGVNNYGVKQGGEVIGEVE